MIAQPLIVNAALTGMVPRRDRVPAVPVTPDQIVEDAERCHRAGAAIVHLHARDENEDPTWRREAYEAFVPEIRRRCPELIVCVTTSGRNWPDLDRRLEVLGLAGDAKPDMASLTLGSLNFRDGASVNSIETIETLASAMLAAGVKPELEIPPTPRASPTWSPRSRRGPSGRPPGSAATSSRPTGSPCSWAVTCARGSRTVR